MTTYHLVREDNPHAKYWTLYERKDSKEFSDEMFRFDQVPIENSKKMSVTMYTRTRETLLWNINEARAVFSSFVLLETDYPDSITRFDLP